MVVIEPLVVRELSLYLTTEGKIQACVDASADLPSAWPLRPTLNEPTVAHLNRA